MGKQKIIAIVGPTASGKTSLSIYLAKTLGGEVVSADSRQVYRGLTIGTGKVTKKEMTGIRHHLLDVASPKRVFSVSHFVRLSRTALQAIHGRGKTAIVAGGTGLYIDTLLGRMSFADVPPNTVLRARLERKTVKQLFSTLQKKDPRRAATIEPDHKRRLVRALEIAHALGATPLPKTNTPYDVLWIGVQLPEHKLKKNIHDRLLARMRAGMVAEAKRLRREGLSLRRMEGLGLEYRALAQLLQNKKTKKEMVDELERDIVRYAKRQLRWFRRNPNIQWVHSKHEALRLAKKFLKE